MAGFALIPALWRSGAFAAAAATNVVLGGAALIPARRFDAPVPVSLDVGGSDAPASSGEGAPDRRREPDRLARAAVLAATALSGFAAMTYQVSWNRLLFVQIGSTVYAFTTILVVFILGLGAGAFVIGRMGDRIRNPVFLLGVTQALIAVSALWIVPWLADLPLRMAAWIAEAGRAEAEGRTIDARELRRRAEPFGAP